MSLSLSQKQVKIIEFARTHDNKITKKEAVDLLGYCYYHNEAKYVGEILSRMVNNRTLNRVKAGQFEISSGAKITGTRAIIIDEKQPTLF